LLEVLFALTLNLLLQVFKFVDYCQLRIIVLNDCLATLVTVLSFTSTGLLGSFQWPLHIRVCALDLLCKHEVA
jgi:hypothetical protein